MPTSAYSDGIEAETSCELANSMQIKSSTQHTYSTRVYESNVSIIRNTALLVVGI